MTYSSPELVVLGRADLLVLGDIDGFNDHVGSLTQAPMGIALGLDD
jgi:hypothetical protein